MANEPQTWSPFRELDRFRRDFDDLFDRFLGVSRQSPGSGPALESYVDNGKLVVRADLPGIDPKDVEITASGDQLMIRGRREQRREEKGHDFIHREVAYGSFERVVKLPSGVDPDQIKASYNNGVLELTAPLPEQSQTRRVPIQSGGSEGSSSGSKF
ncbi:MAG: Hsp20/alpha crystallin family protein [Deltaproteobacteria bacterium]|nr:Hsp20/alpha crystallin family protein [Deltaproteobacteria bacterium]